MPPIYLHLKIARESAQRLGHPILDANQGSYLLGSTSPDIRIVTGAAREDTHFFSLGEEEERGVDQFFQANPELANRSDLTEGTQAFVCGYLSHLITDEVWIREIFRPCFGRGSPLGKDPMANLLDRALQFELDQRERLEREEVAQIQAELSSLNSGIVLDLIEPGALEQWRQFVCAAAGREPGWERFRAFAQRHLVPEGKVGAEQVEAFLADLPAMLERAFAVVTPQRVTAFREKAVEGSIAAAKEYLS